MSDPQQPARPSLRRRLRVALWAGTALVLPTAHASQSLDSLQWVTEEYAPYNYSVNGVPTGIFVDILGKVWERLGVHRKVSDIQVLPWARGYRMAQDTPGVCLFSMTVTDQRRQLFAMVQPVVDSRVSIVGPAKGGIAIHSLADLDNYSIGVVRDDIGEQLLQQGGTKARIVRTDSARSLVKMLSGGRFEVIAYSYDTAAWNMKQEGVEVSAYAPLYTLRAGVMGFGCQKDTDPKLIAQLQETVDQLRADGTVERIARRYLK